MCFFTFLPFFHPPWPPTTSRYVLTFNPHIRALFFPTSSLSPLSSPLPSSPWTAGAAVFRSPLRYLCTEGTSWPAPVCRSESWCRPSSSCSWCSGFYWICGEGVREVGQRGRGGKWRGGGQWKDFLVKSANLCQEMLILQILLQHNVKMPKYQNIEERKA